MLHRTLSCGSHEVHEQRQIRMGLQHLPGRARLQGRYILVDVSWVAGENVVVPLPLGDGSFGA